MHGLMFGLHIFFSMAKIITVRAFYKAFLFVHSNEMFIQGAAAAAIFCVVLKCHRTLVALINLLLLESMNGLCLMHPQS